MPSLDHLRRSDTGRKAAVVLAALTCMAALFVLAARAKDEGTEKRNIYIPATISPEAQQILKNLSKEKIYEGELPAPDDLEGWRKVHAKGESSDKEDEEAVKRSGVTVTETALGGVPVLDIRPRDWKDNGKVLVYTHGGAFTMFSVHSSLDSSVPMSRATGLRLISVDYTTAPFANWKEIQEQVIKVFKALRAKGYAMKDIAIYGDSAGGGLAVSAVLQMRDRGMDMPSAVVLLSPWADLNDIGDTAHTLKAADPILIYEPSLKNSALAYADGLDLSNPRVSPLYADFSEGFPPCLITDGTKCIFLSTSVRLYQALEAAGREVKLDIYEGMWHVFQLYPMPESETANRKAAQFIRDKLGI
jgi:acetyl esterase/lipase